VALEKLALIEEYGRKMKAPRYRDLMRAHETMEVLKIARLTVLASMQRKESGRAYYRIAEYPNLNPQLNKVLVAWQENGQPKFSWGI
jgi:succinate dehydrogenase/fumarate reductase flavoprotein subunit